MTENYTKESIKKLNVFDNTYDELLTSAEEILKKTELIEKNIGDTPISPMTLPDNDNYVIYKNDVVKEYEKIISKLSNPETAKEYGYLLAGIKESTGNIIIETILDIGDYSKISNRQIGYDNEKLNNYLKALYDVGYNFFSICHTHPLIDEAELTTTIVNYLPEQMIDEQYIRYPGLNFSLQDLLNYKSVFDQAKKYFPNATFTSTVFMYNGEVAMLGMENNKITRFINIINEETKENLPVSSKEEYQTKKNK